MYLCGKFIKEVDMENIAFSRVEDILAKSAMEFDRKIAEITKQQAENALQIVAIAKSQEKTDLQMAETDRKIVALIKSQEKTDLQMAATDRKIAAVTSQIGGWDKSHGQFAEEYFINSLKSGDKKFFGEQFHSLFANHKFSHSITKKEGEFDVVLLNGSAAAIIEVKFKARKNDFQQLLNQVTSFREEFPQYKSHRVYLGMAALTFEDQVEEECKREGIAVFKQDGENVVIYDENLKTF